MAESGEHLQAAPVTQETCNTSDFFEPDHGDEDRYREVTTKTSVPVKTGDDEHDDEQRDDDSRPNTGSTTHGTKSEILDQADIKFLARTSVSKTTEGIPATPSSMQEPKLLKRSELTENTAPEEFRFPAVNRRHAKVTSTPQSNKEQISGSGVVQDVTLKEPPDVQVDPPKPQPQTETVNAPQTQTTASCQLSAEVSVQTQETSITQPRKKGIWVKVPGKKGNKKKHMSRERRNVHPADPAQVQPSLKRDADLEQMPEKVNSSPTVVRNDHHNHESIVEPQIPEEQVHSQHDSPAHGNDDTQRPASEDGKSTAAHQLNQVLQPEPSGSMQEIDENGENLPPQVHESSATAGHHFTQKPRKRKRGQSADNADFDLEIGPQDSLGSLFHNLRNMKGQITQLYAERESNKEQLGKSLEARGLLETELRLIQEQKKALELSLREQRTEVVNCVSKVKGFKRFVDGLGRDSQALKKDASAARNLQEELRHETETRNSEQRLLQEQLSVCSEKSISLKNETLKLCQETQLELARTKLQNESLERELSEKVGLLVEERDYRALIARQAAAAHQPNYHEALLGPMKTHTEAVLDKLFVIHAAIDSAKDQNTATELIEKTFKAIEDLGTQQAAAADTITSVRTLIDSLPESLEKLLQASTPSQDNEQSAMASVQNCIDKAIAELTHQLDTREESLKNDARLNEAIAVLQEQLTNSQHKIESTLSQLSAAQSRESQLKAANEDLQGRISALEETSVADQINLKKLGDIERKCLAQETTLDLTNTELTGKAEELKKLQTVNSTLQSEIDTIRQRPQEKSTGAADFQQEREKLNQKHRAQLVRITHAAETFESEVKLKRDNEIKKLTAQKNNTEKEKNAIFEDLSKTKTELEGLKSVNSGDLAKLKSELQDLRKSHKREIESYESRLKKSSSVEENSSKSSSRISAENVKLKKASADLQHELQTAQATLAETKQQTEQIEKQRTTEVDALNNQVLEANSKATSATTELAHFKETSRLATGSEQEKHNETIRDLEQRVVRAESELRKRIKEDDDFRAEVDKTWKAERQSYTEEIATLKSTIASLLNQDEKTLVETSEHQVSSVEVSADQVKFSPQEGDHTPPVMEAENQPHKPRKASSGKTVDAADTAPVPTPSILRPKAKGPIVEETQSQPDIDLFKHFDGPLSSFSFSEFEEPDTAKAPPNAGLQPSTATLEKEHAPSTTVNEHNIRSSGSLEVIGQIPGFSVPFIRGKEDTIGSAFFAENSIVEDSQGKHAPRTLPQSSGSRASDEGNFRSSQGIEDQYSYRKPTPQPNSGQKLLRRSTDRSSNGLQRESNELGLSNRRHLNRSQEQIETVTYTEVSQSRTWSSQSSSFDFMNAETNGNRKLNTYQHSSQYTSGNRDKTKDKPAPSSDPRPPRRESNVVSKRKAAETQGDAYEPKSNKKRVAQAPAPVTRRETRASLRKPSVSASQSQASPGGYASQLRMMNLGGSPAAARRLPRHPSNRNKYSERFSQELN